VSVSTGAHCKPRYFFDVEDGDRTVDEVGMELEGLRAAAVKAMKTLLEVGRFEVVIKNERRLTVVVRDESGKSVYRTEMAIEADWIIDDWQARVPA
jgi:C4-type Zn-finger protein